LTQGKTAGPAARAARSRGGVGTARADNLHARMLQIISPCLKPPGDRLVNASAKTAADTPLSSPVTLIQMNFSDGTILASTGALRCMDV
ncbi:hypothetical protein, partial [Brevundimonas sp.]|uniref:hypothetical protein n=1 Tax=Brevundimonas sp. TaxID=1871086 RepID=UPI0025C1F3FC